MPPSSHPTRATPFCSKLAERFGHNVSPVLIFYQSLSAPLLIGTVFRFFSLTLSLALSQFPTAKCVAYTGWLVHAMQLSN